MKEPLDFKQLEDLFFFSFFSPFFSVFSLFVHARVFGCIMRARFVCVGPEVSLPGLAVREDGLVPSHAQNNNELETRRGNKDARRIARGNYTPPLDSCLCSFENNLNIKYLK